MKKTFLFVLALACLVSCTPREKDFGVESPTYGTSTVQRTKVPYQDAVASLASTLEAIGTPEYTGKLALARQPQYVTASHAMSPSLLTKSTADTTGAVVNGTDTLYYLVNFGTDEGYAILAADSRLPQRVLAVTERGSVSPEDFDPEHGTWPIGGSDGLFSSPDANGGTTIHIPGGNIGGGGGGTSSGGNSPFTQDKLIERNVKETVIDEVEPLVKVNFHQDAPFNSLYRQKYGLSYDPPAGCVMIALLHLFSYFEYPSTFGGLSGDWAKIKQENSDQGAETQRVMPTWTYNIAVACAAVPSRDGTSSSIISAATYLRVYCSKCFKNIRRETLESKKYNGESDNYNDEQFTEAKNMVYDMINSNRPVYCRGEGPDGGHAFILDGYLHILREYDLYSYITGNYVKSSSSYQTLIHCNWGYEGENNGYFFIHNLDLKDAKEYDNNLHGQTFEFNDNNQFIYYEVTDAYKR